MKVLYDHYIFTDQKYGGISRYFYELIKFFNINKNVEVSVPLVFSNNYYIKDCKDVDHLQFFPNHSFKGKQKLLFLMNRAVLILHLRRKNFNIYHPTYYDTFFLNFIGNEKVVVTVYDMIHEKFKYLFPDNDKTTSNKRIVCQKSSKIIAISQSTKKDLIELFNIEESKIEVIYLGNSMVLNKKFEVSCKLPEKYILFVGGRGGYKNFDKFIKGVGSLLNNNLSVVCVGGGKFTDEELFLFEKLNVSNKVLHFDFPDDDSLAYCYSQALMFVFPSLYEGFGIPILESFACGCPLVCSNTSSFPEVASDGAEYFDPYSVKSIYTSVKKVLDSNDLRELLIQNGTERLKYFSWEKTAIKTKNIYDNLLN